MAALALTLVPTLTDPATVGLGWLAVSPAAADPGPGSMLLDASAQAFTTAGAVSMTVSWGTALGGGNTVTVYDLTTGAVVATCSDPVATGCGVMSPADPPPFVSGGPHYYQAFLAPGTSTDPRQDATVRSNQTMLSRAPFTVDLTWSNLHAGNVSDGESSLVDGDVVTVTATANQALPSSQPYRVRIVDNDGTQLCVSTSGQATCSATTTIANASTWPLRALVSLAAGGDVQAWSSPVSFTRAPYQVSIVTTVVTSTTVTATVSRALDAGDALEVWNLSSNTKIATCSSGSSCQAVESGATGATYQGVVVRGGANVAVSAGANSAASAYQVNLAVSDATVKAGQFTTLTATTNLALTGQLKIAIVDTWQGTEVIKSCGTGLTCSIDVQYYDALRTGTVGNDRRYYAYIATVNSTTSTLGTDVRAQSNAVDLKPWAWSVSLATDQTIFEAGTAPVLTATEGTGQDIGATAGNYQIVIMDMTRPMYIKVCSNNTAAPGGVCSGSISSNGQYGRFTGGYRHEYRAFIGKGSNLAGFTQNLPTQLAAFSNTIRLARASWEISWDGTTARWNQDLNGTMQDGPVSPSTAAYKVYIVDRDQWPTGGSGMVLGSCSANAVGVPVTSCTPTLTTFNGQYVRTMAVVAGNGGQPATDLQATSDGYSANPWLGQLDPLTQPGGMSACAVDQAADPCNPSIGEYYENYTDLSVPARMPALVQRSYSSQRSTVLGLFGYGWFSNIDARLTRPSTTSNGVDLDPITIDTGSGAVSYFDQYPGSDTFPARTGNHATLAATGDADGNGTFNDPGYRYTGPDGASLRFSAAGNLLSKADRAGNKVSYTRSSSAIVASTADGRTITVGLNADGTAATLTGPEGRVITYGYDTNKNLTTVTDPRGKVWRFGYGTPTTHRITTKATPVQFAAGVSVINTYDAQGRISTQSVPMNPAAGGTTPQTALTTFAYSGTWPSLAVTVTGPVTTTKYEYEQGYLIAKTINPTGTNAIGWRYSYDLDGNRVQIVDGDGVTALASFDANGHQTSATDSAGNVTTWTVDGYGAVTSETFTDATGTHINETDVDSLGRPTQIRVDNPAAVPAGGSNQVTDYVYGDPAHPSDITRVTDPTGVATTFSYTPEGFIASSTRASTTPAYTVKDTWTYNGYGDMLTHRLPRGNCAVTTGPDACDTAAQESATYVPFTSLPATRTAPANNAGVTATRTVGTFTYTDDGQVATATDGTGVTTTSTYWLDGTLRTVATPLGGLVTYDHDGEGNATRTTTKITAALDAVTTRSYNNLGQVATQVSAEGNKAGQVAAYKTARTSTYTYTRAGRLKSVSVPDPAGGTITTSTTYDFAGRPWKITDPEGRVTTTVYGRDNQIAATIAPDGGTTAYTYDPDGNVASIDRPPHTSVENGTEAARTEYLYDGAGRVRYVRQFNASGNAFEQSSYEYTPAGDLWKVVSPRGWELGAVTSDHTTSTGFAPDGTPNSVTDPDGALTATRHALDGTTTTRIDPVGRTSTTTYDAAGRLKTAVRPGSVTGTTETTAYSYDGDGRLSAIEPPRSTAGSIKWQYGYDLAGRPTTQTDPLARTTTTNYNLDGATTSVITRIGGAAGTITYTIDPLGRITATTYGDGSTGSSATFYKDSRTKTITDATGTTTYVYDTAGRPATRTNGTSVWAWTWNPDSTLATRTRPSGLAETFSYDRGGRLTSVGRGGSTAQQYAYDADSNILSASLNAASAQQEWTYDNSGDLTTSTIRGTAGATLATAAITRNADGAPRQVTTTRGGTTSIKAFQYDGTGRLQGICYAAATACTTTAQAQQWWTYDANGNRTGERDGTGTGALTSWTYNNADQPATRIDPSYATHVTGAAPRAYWKLATTADSAGTYTLTNNGTVTLNAAGAYGTASKSATMTATSGKYLSAATAAGDLTTAGGKMTISTWIKGAAGQTSSTGLVCKGTWLAEQYCLEVFSSKYRVLTRNSAGTASLLNSTKGPDGTWQHLSVVIDTSTGGRGLEIWINGVKDATAAAPTSIQASTQPVTLGNRRSATGVYDKPFTGSIGDTAIWHTAVTPDDLNRIGTAGAGGTSTYSIDNNGNTLTDGTTTATYRLDGKVKTTVAGGTTHTYMLDAAGNRVQDTTTATVKFDIDPLDPTSVLTRNTTVATEIYTGPTGVIGLTTTSGTGFYAKGYDGSVTDTVFGGALGRSYDFTPFGSARIEVPGAPAAGTGPGALHGFQAMLGAGYTGASYTPNRIYNANDGQFTGSDPAFMSSGPNWNGPNVFANNNPGLYSDPTGASPLDALKQAATEVFKPVLGIIDGADPIGLRKRVTDGLGWGNLGGVEDLCSTSYQVGVLGGEIGSMFISGVGALKLVKFAGKHGFGILRAGLGGLGRGNIRLLARGAWREFVPEARPVLFGQARIGSSFSTKADVPAYLSGRPLADVTAELRAGRMSPDAIPITAFEREGQLVTVNNRGLAALSDAGFRPTNLTIVDKDSLPADVLSRLSEVPTPLGSPLPWPSIAVTPSKSDWTVLRTISVPGLG